MPRIPLSRFPVSRLPVSRFVTMAVMLAGGLLAGCQYNPLNSGPPAPMMATGSPCGFRAVDAGLCPRVGYRLPPGLSY